MMKRLTKTAALLALGLPAACASSPHGRQLEVSYRAGHVPVADWTNCSKADASQCSGEEMAVSALIFTADPHCDLTLASGEKLKGLETAGDLRRQVWKVFAAPGQRLTPPVVYGQAPEGARVEPAGAPVAIPESCKVLISAADLGALSKDVSQKIDAATQSDDDMPGAAAEGTHAAQALPGGGAVQCYFGQLKMGAVNLSTLVRRTMDGADLIEDSASFVKGAPPSRVVLRYKAGEAGKHQVVPIYTAHEISNGAGTFEAGADGAWSKWTAGYDIAGVTRVEVQGSLGEGGLSTQTDIAVNGKSRPPVKASLAPIDAAECGKRMSRVAPVEGL